jgi:hypothetical protein
MKKASYKNTVIKMTAKCSDLYNHWITSDEGISKEYEGYVPSFFPEGGGDYITLDIDPYTGKILNWTCWKKPKKA